MTPLLFSCRLADLSIVPPMRSSRSPSATTLCSRRPIPEKEHIQHVASAPHFGNKSQFVVVVQRRRIEPDQDSESTPGASSPASAIALQPIRPGEENPSVARPPAT